MTWSWGSMLSKQSCLNTHLLICAIPKSCTLPSAWPVLDAWIAWSFEALAKGWRPCEDPWGKGSWHPLLASLRLKGTTGQHCGQYRVMLNFTQMSSKLDIGPPSILAACPSGKSVKILKASGQDCKYVCPAEALLAKKNNHVLFGIPGVSTAMIRGDALHILHSRAFHDWPNRQKVSASKRIQVIFAKVRDIYSERGISNRLTNLRLSMITETQSPFKAFPVLECKAAECKWFVPVLEQILADCLDFGVDIHQSMVQCCKAFNQLVQHFDGCGAFLTAAEFAAAQELSTSFFNRYSRLNCWAAEEGRKLFHITFKFHSMLHLVQNSKWMNIRLHANYRAEPFVGQMSVTGHSVSFGNKATRVCTKLMQKYLVLLHLQLTRPGFGDQPEDDCDPYLDGRRGCYLFV